MPFTKTKATRNMSSNSRSSRNTSSTVCHTIKPSMLEIPKLGIHFVIIKTNLLIQTLGDMPFLTSMIMCNLLCFEINDVGDPVTVSNNTLEMSSMVISQGFIILFHMEAKLFTSIPMDLNGITPSGRIAPFPHIE